MNLHVGDTVMFGPPGKPRVSGKVLRAGKKALIRQTAPGHGVSVGTEWNVPATSAYIEVAREAPPPRSSRPREAARRPSGSKVAVRHSTSPDRTLTWTIGDDGASVGDYDWDAGTGKLTYRYERASRRGDDAVEREKSLGKYRSLEAASAAVFRNIDRNRARYEARRARRASR
jgi:hypothetical protein